MQIGWRSSEHLDINFTLFNNRYEDFIKELIVTTIDTPEGEREVDDEYAINADQVNVMGTELLIHYKPMHKLSLRAELTSLFETEQTIGAIDSNLNLESDIDLEKSDLFFIADHTASLLGSYQFSPFWQFGSRISYVSSRNVPDFYQNDIDPDVQESSNADSYFKLDLTSTLKISKQLTLNVLATNITDQQIYSPPIDNPEKYDNEWQGRAFYIKARYKN